MMESPKIKLPRKMNRIIKILLIVGIICIGIILIPVTKLTAETYKEDLSILAEPLPKSLMIFDRNGQVVSELSSAKFKSIPLSEIPDILVSSIIAVEDKRFYKHSGIDIFGIGRSAWRNIGAGSIVGGGSTITQQLAKNLFLTSEQTYTRKMKEAIIAFRIEGKYTKDEILELYLNQIYFGEGRWGVQDAAMVYFRKDIQDITISEAALLAALPKAPTHYSPFKDMEKAKERRDLVLNILYDQNIINKEELKIALDEEIILNHEKSNPLGGKFPSYVDYVVEEAVYKYGFNEEEVLKGGLQIYTQIDPLVQRSIEEAYKLDELFPESSGEEIVESGSIVIDPYTGGVRGLLGYRGGHSYRGFNRATQLKRQPGSSIKPLAVYAPALESGYRQNSMLVDRKMNFSGYSPTNLNGRYRGRISLYNAVVHSINIPAVSLLDEIGLETGMEFLERAGIGLHENDRNLSIALGGFTEGVSPLEMAQGFSIFPNLGMMKKAHAITRIESNTGEVLLEVEEEAVEVMKAENAYRMTRILMGVVEEGSGRNARLNRPTAGKTGTTQLPSTDEFKGVSGARDAWFVGYTPELVAAVWVGYDKNDPNFVMKSSGGNHPAKIFKEIMSNALKDVEVSSFEVPKGYKEERKTYKPIKEKEEIKEKEDGEEDEIEDLKNKEDQREKEENQGEKEVDHGEEEENHEEKEGNKEKDKEKDKDKEKQEEEKEEEEDYKDEEESGEEEKEGVSDI